VPAELDVETPGNGQTRSLMSMAKESVQKKLERVRPPRVNITYEVETGDAIETKELPFVMGVLGDFSGKPVEPLGKLKNRNFTEVTLDNFDDVLAGAKPRLQYSVENKLTEEGGKIGVELEFQSLEDFNPDRVAQNVEPLAKLLDLRAQLADLRGKLQVNEKLEEILQSAVSDEQKLKKLRDEIGSEGDEGGK
jgi:type VI secretion system protein ImpB